MWERNLGETLRGGQQGSSYGHQGQLLQHWGPQTGVGMRPAFVEWGVLAPVLLLSLLIIIPNGVIICSYYCLPLLNPGEVLPLVGCGEMLVVRGHGEASPRGHLAW